MLHELIFLQFCLLLQSSYDVVLFRQFLDLLFGFFADILFIVDHINARHVSLEYDVQLGNPACPPCRPEREDLLEHFLVVQIDAPVGLTVRHKHEMLGQTKVLCSDADYVTEEFSFFGAPHFQGVLQVLNNKDGAVILIFVVKDRPV